VLRRLMVALLAAAVLAGCASTRPDMAALKPTEDTSTAVIKITHPTGGEEYVSRKEFEQARDKLFQGAPEQFVLDYLATRRLLLREARGKEVSADPQEVDEFVERIKTQTCSQAPLPEAQSETDPAKLLDTCAQFFGFDDAAAMRRYLQQEITITNLVEQEVQPAESDVAEEIHAAHILVETEEEAQEVRERVTTGGEDFATVAKEVSIEPAAKESGGDLGFFGPGQMIESFDQAARALEDGEISQPVQTQFGWHIIKTIERREAAPEAQEQARQQAAQAAGQAYRDRILEEAKQANQVTYLITPAPEPTQPPPPMELPTVEVDPGESGETAAPEVPVTATPAP
jgi:parvulin-like peptidyl-prolyl isomerase